MADSDTEQADYPNHAEKANILIVDDVPEKLLIYKTILDELGQNLVFASSGAEALKHVLKQDFAVILLDVNMPGMDGFETASLIRGRKKSSRMPIIFLTAFTDEIHMAQGYASGAVDYLPTPVVPEILKAKVRVFIELSQMRQQAASRAEEQALQAAAEESARRNDFLVRVSETLAQSKSPPEVLTALLHLPVPSLADVSAACIYEEGEEQGEMQWLWNGHDQKSLASMDAFMEAVPGLKDAVQISERGEMQFLNGLPASPAAAGLPDLQDIIILPLAVKNETRGIFLLARERSGPPYQITDINLAKAFAGRGSIALENAMLIQRIQEADQRKDVFLATLAHELRNPLAPISNALQVMKLIDAGPQITGMREIMQRQVQHMSRLVDDLLDVSRITRGKIEFKRERVLLSTVIESAVESSRSLIEEACHILAIDLPREPVWLTGDMTRLSQVFSNLLNNAAKYTDTEGRIFLTARLEGTSVLVSVRDTGIGISKQMLPKVFDIFAQADSSIERSRGGLGIGLKLVKELCELHGGSVTALSAGQGQGSEFIVRLPVAGKEEAVIPA